MPENDRPFMVNIPVNMKELAEQTHAAYTAIYGVEGQNGLKRQAKEIERQVSASEKNLTDKIDELETRLRKSEIRISAAVGGVGAISIILNVLSYLGK